MHKLILASESPRRKHLLEEAGFLFRVFSVKVSENIEKNLNSEADINAEILRITRTKAEAALQAFKPLESGDYLFLSADTLVIYGHRPLGKPKSSTEAEEFLGLLSGKSHQVKTGICLLTSKFENDRWGPTQTSLALETTEVTFRPILRHEILEYIKSGEPMDKAGAYAIQGQGKKFVENFKGDYNSIVGLPIALFDKKLDELQIQVERK